MIRATILPAGAALHRLRSRAVVAGAIALAAAGSAPAQDMYARPGRPWEFSLNGFYYFPRQDDNFGLLVGQAKKGTLHLEARYNYEALDTGSLWAGRTFSGGEALTWEITPMAGAVFGQLNGLAPGLEAGLAWRGLDFYLEAEYVFDLSTKEDSFFYAWSELAYSPWEWLRFGLVTQRTRLYRSDRDVQRGPFVQFNLGPATLGFYVFNPGGDAAVGIVSLGAQF
jgi:hypothetical protein